MDMYKFNLDTYVFPPLEYCTLIDLGRICEERLQLYKIMDNASNLDYKPNSETWDKYVELQILQYKLMSYIILLKCDEFMVGQVKARRNNHIAHWLLSLCYCPTKGLRSFFMNCELYWFVMLYKRTKKEDLQEFCAQNDIKFTCISEKEKYLLKEKLITCRPMKECDFNNQIYYRSKFNDISNLVAIRKVFIYKGFAYFPEKDLIYCLKNKLWKQFNKQLLWNNKMLPTNIKEERYENFLKNISLVEPSYKRFSERKIVINLENIDEFAKMHFPLCMKSLHSILRRDHHLKYDCKMQYGIFLKWVGLSFQNAMELWKDEFTQKMSSEWFDRKYSYLFRYQYGKVGNMVRYNPFTCQKILNKCPETDQHHGCPFKHWDLQKVIQECYNEGFTMEDINDLKILINDNKYREACSLYFSVTHKVCMTDVIKSPNQYVEASYEFEDSLNTCLSTIFNDC